tara:strand:- start:884 stop:2977 length:2094 start_codon:yes stop_codon:yes gene_type:complete
MLCPLISLDLQIPMKKNGPNNTEYGVEVGKYAQMHQPLQKLVVLTSYPNWRSLRELGQSQVVFLEKFSDILDANAYGQEMIKQLHDFEQYDVWQTASHILPDVLGRFCSNFLKDDTKSASDRFRNWKFLVENGLHLFFLTSLATIYKLGGNVSEIIKPLSGNFLKIGGILSQLDVILSSLEELLEESNNAIALREVKKYFHNSDFAEVAEYCTRLRNRDSHDARKLTAKDLQEYYPWFVNWTVSCGFWSIHPLVTDLEVVSREGKMSLRGSPIKGLGEPVKKEVWRWDPDFVVEKDRVYQIICDPDHPERAFLISLFPLVRKESNDHDALWFADIPSKNQYRNLLTGDIKEFSDEYLSEWWLKAKSDTGNFKKNIVEPLRKNSTKSADVDKDSIKTHPTKKTPQLNPVISSRTGETKFDYDATAQPWYVKDFPPTKEMKEEAALRLVEKIDILLFTATDEELKAVLRLLKPHGRRKNIVLTYSGPETYYLGKFGAYGAAVTKCRMGSIGQGSVTLAAEQGQRLWKPKAVLMVGIAFGRDEQKQKIADVLVASQIIPYEKQRVDESGVKFRDPIPPTCSTLLNRFENTQNWMFNRPCGTQSHMIVGPILSGEKLVDDPDFKQTLLDAFPTAVGGEMEGAGLCAATGRVGTPWILVKSVCDWADGQKKDKHQPLAAAAAASLVHHVLSQETVLNSLSVR